MYEDLKAESQARRARNLVGLAAVLALCCVCLVIAAAVGIYLASVDAAGFEDLSVELPAVLDTAEIVVSPAAVSAEDIARGDAVAVNTAAAGDTAVPDSTVQATVPAAQATIPAAPTVVATGHSRANPFPRSELVAAPNWDIQVQEIVRGDDAWSRIQVVNQFNEPPPEGNEYILVRVDVRNTADDTEQHAIGGSDFGLTGSNLIHYLPASVVEPEPQLDAELFSGEETEGWIAFLVSEGEKNLILVFDEFFNFAEDRQRYIALDEDAAVVIDPVSLAGDVSAAGKSRSDPIAPGTTARTDAWEVTALEIVRGDKAWSMAQAANEFNDPPAEGMEYVAVKWHVRNVSLEDREKNIDGAFFDVTGSSHIVHRDPAIVEPEPAMDVHLYPGGEYEGWTIKQAEVGETDLLVIFAPLLSSDENERRFLALEEGAAVEIPAAVALVTANDAGREQIDPAAFGEVVITDDWEISVLEVVRGGGALEMAQGANQFNDPPDPGMEFVAVRIAARNVGEEDSARFIDESAFALTGDAGIVYDPPVIVEPEPKLDRRLYPAGRAEGWIILQVAAGETGLLLVYEPLFSGERRYLALE